MANPLRVPSQTCKQQGERKLIRKACSSPARRLQKAGNARRLRRPCNQKLLHARSSVRRHTQGDRHCWGTDGSGGLCCETMRQPAGPANSLYVSNGNRLLQNLRPKLSTSARLAKVAPCLLRVLGLRAFFLALGASSCHFKISCIRQVLSTWTGRSLNL